MSEYQPSSEIVLSAIELLEEVAEQGQAVHDETMFQIAREKLDAALQEWEDLGVIGMDGERVSCMLGLSGVRYFPEEGRRRRKRTPATRSAD